MIKIPALASRKATLVAGLLASTMKTRLAADQALDLAPVLKGVTRKTFKADKPKIFSRLAAQTKGKLAADANLDDVIELLDSMDDVDAGAMDEDKVEEKKADEPKADDEDDTPAMDAEAIAKYCADNGMSSDAMEGLRALMGPKANDGDPEPKGGEEKVDKKAMDRAIATAVAKTAKDAKAGIAALLEARELVRPYIGEVSFAMDSADEILRTALEANDIDLAGVHPSAYRAMLKLVPLPGTVPEPKVHKFASDASSSAELRTLFPSYRPAQRA